MTGRCSAERPDNVLTPYKEYSGVESGGVLKLARWQYPGLNLVLEPQAYVRGSACVRSSIDGSDKGGSDWALARFVYRGSELSTPTPAEHRDNAEPPDQWMKAQSSPSHILLTITWQLGCKTSGLVIDLLGQSGLPENILHKLYRKFYLE